MKRKSIRPEFVDIVPDSLEDGVLYISVPYATATHKCPCGCGEIVVTPIRPTDWTLTWNGETVTLDPSVGSWSLPCQSHYWIVENRIVWARKWTASEIAAGREKDRRAKARYYAKPRAPSADSTTPRTLMRQDRGFLGGTSMPKNRVKAVALVHQSGLNLSGATRRSLSTVEAWRLKNWEAHPLDPGWEDGVYCLCHKRFRNSGSRSSGEIVVDCVNPGGAPNDGYIVRSFFEVAGDPVACQFAGSGQDLLFDSYFFADHEPYLLRCGTTGHDSQQLTAVAVAELLKHRSYNRYRVSFNRGPASIAQRDWRVMAETKREKKAEWLRSGNSCCRS